jgi:hypothetical protein
MSMVQEHLDIIKKFYGDDRAKRSGILLINHILEGLDVLQYLNASDMVKSAWCIHPIVQSDKDFTNELNHKMLHPADSSAILLAVEYRHIANSFLSIDLERIESDEIIDMGELLLGQMYSDTIKLMLIADKVQNHKDFIKQPPNTYPNADNLDRYFRLWLYDILKLTKEQHESILGAIKL